MKANSFKVYGQLLKNARGTVIFMTVSGVIAGLCSAGILALVNQALNKDHHITTLLISGFIALAVAKIVSNAASQLLLVKFSQTTILNLSISLCGRVLNAPLRVIERHGGANIMTTLTDDVGAVTWAVQVMPQLAMNASIVIGCSLYIAWLSKTMFLGAMIVGLLGVGVYKLLHTRAVARIQAARDARERLFEHFRTLTGGIKELMLHKDRRDSFLNQEINRAAQEYRSNNIVATKNYAIAEGWVQTLYHALMALVLFVSPILLEASPEALTGYMFAMLYMMTPLWNIIGSLPPIAQGKVALERIDKLNKSIEQHSVAHYNELTDGKSSSTEVSERQLPKASHIEMKDIAFTYASKSQIKDGDHPFALGPLDFSLAPGELVFVIGGNGSGKSTFVKVLTGLYAPSSGSLKIDGKEVTEFSRELYRENFSVVFAEVFVFDKLLGLNSPDLETNALKYLKLLQIDHKVSIRSGAHGLEFTTTQLSTGQRKRLALVTAYLEDRPIYVFDEWAADQDPEYKKIFYSKLLPDLRNRGKAVVVITHDDRYFSMGDRVVKLDDGKVVDWVPTPDSELEVPIKLPNPHHV